MKIVAAPDSFKGSSSSLRICHAMEQGIRKVYPDAEVVRVPLADGGEGTMDNLVHASGGKLVTVMASDPLSRPIKARYGVLDNGSTAVIEMAEASGLTRLEKTERDPGKTTSYGTGELIRHALDAGYRDFIIGLGGSATNDGGAGLLQALGMKLSDADGGQLHPGGLNLEQLREIDDSAFDERIRESRIVVACDVKNPLCGPDGASAVFGPQKGAAPAMIAMLDDGLAHYADVVRQHCGKDVRHLPGSGAAGGAGAALLAYLGADMRSGIQLVLESVGFEAKIRDADWILTGEGRLDEQTLSGKVIAGVCEAARKYRVPVLAVCGSAGLSQEAMAQIGLTACFSLVPGPCSLEEAMQHTDDWISERTTNIFRLIAARDR
jgi:glycerate 2-kinase